MNWRSNSVPNTSRLSRPLRTWIQIPKTVRISRRCSMSSMRPVRINSYNIIFNHYVGGLLEMQRHVQAQRLGSLEIKPLGRRIIGVDSCKAGIPLRREYREY